MVDQGEYDYMQDPLDKKMRHLEIVGENLLAFVGGRGARLRWGGAERAYGRGGLLCMCASGRHFSQSVSLQPPCPAALASCRARVAAAAAQPRAALAALHAKPARRLLLPPPPHGPDHRWVWADLGVVV